MINSLYKNYFQKSRSFLYPALGIKKKSPFYPTQTYIAMEEPPVKPEDRKLICLFNSQEDPQFEKFESNFLTGNPLFSEFIICPNGDRVYIFNYEAHKEDWDHFLNGKYSKLSEAFKTAIKHYYGHASKEYEYMDSYLYPENYFEQYKSLLDVDLDTLIRVGELCDRYNLEQETLVLSPINLEVIV